VVGGMGENEIAVTSADEGTEGRDETDDEEDEDALDEARTVEDATPDDPDKDERGCDNDVALDDMLDCKGRVPVAAAADEEDTPFDGGR
jgi:hypothetical protein